MYANHRLIPVFFAVLLASLGSPAVGSILIDLNTPFPDGPTTFKRTPDGTPPWLTAEFEQLDVNQVQLTLTAKLVADNDVRGGQGGGPVNWGWGFNFNPAKDVTALVFSYESGNAASKIGQVANAYTPDGLGSEFDILFGWTNSSSLSGSDTAIYSISLTSGGLVDADFDFFSDPISSGNTGVFRSAAHIQSLSSPGETSTWIGDGTPDGHNPEPASVIVWAALCATAIACRQR